MTSVILVLVIVNLFVLPEHQKIASLHRYNKSVFCFSVKYGLPDQGCRYIFLLGMRRTKKLELLEGGRSWLERHWNSNDLRSPIDF